VCVCVCVCLCVCVCNYSLSLLLNISADMRHISILVIHAQYMSRTRAADTDHSLKICINKIDREKQAYSAESIGMGST
jgi:hypothetical protein